MNFNERLKQQAASKAGQAPTPNKAPAPSTTAKPPMPPKPTGNVPMPPRPAGTKPPMPPTIPGGPKPQAAMPPSKNPLGKPGTSSAVKPIAPADAVVEKPIEEVKAETPLAKRNNPFIAKAAAKKAEEAKAPEVEKEVAKKAEEVLEKVSEKKEAVTEVKETTEKAKETVKEETPAEPKKSRSRSRAKAQTKTVKEDVSSDETVYEFGAVATEMDYADAINSIKSNFVDEEWITFQDDIKARISEINISNDMTTSAIKVTIEELNGLRDSLWDVHSSTKTMYDSLASKEPEGLIERVKKLNLKGSNDSERKLNSVMSVINYKNQDGLNINLYELLDETRTRYNFLKSVMDSIEYKTKVLITMLGSLKLER